MEGRFLRYVRVLADYQFGMGAGKALFPETCEFIISPKTGKVRQITDRGVRIATVRPESGMLSVSVEGARRLMEVFEFPKLRVAVDHRVGEFIAEGKNVFAKHVISVDPSIRANDEVIVVDSSDELLATGKAILSAHEMLEFGRGVAVSVRHGVKR